MKNIIILISILLSISSCNSTKKITGQNSASSSSVKITHDSLEYQIIIKEPAFNSWLKNQQPQNYYDLGFLEEKNKSMGLTYNKRLTSGNSDSYLYPYQINYVSHHHYGKDVNYLLYQYLFYFQEKYKEKL